MKTTTKRAISFGLTILVLAAIAVNTTGCSGAVQAANLMEDVTAQDVEGKPADAAFISNTADFSLELFRNTITHDENSLISPLSVQLALAMTANGADTETLSQMEAVLGRDISITELNEYLYSYTQLLPSEEKSKLTIANSIWFRDDEDRLVVEPDFLQTNANYFDAPAYASPFDNQTLKDINNWVEENTDGMIDEILDEIAEDAVMYLINALIFDAEWQNVYDKNDINQDEFNAFDGSKQTVDFMRSEESIYLEDSQATGFIKPYADGNYSFVALLPNEDIAIQDYIANLTGQQLLETISSASDSMVGATMPKFSYDYTIQMNDALKDMGMPAAFSAAQADFSKLGRSSRGNIFVKEVLHKTFISIDELGTKAGAVTKVEMGDESAAMEMKEVKLERPFVYAIIDNTNNLPVFIGTVLEINQ